jgi:hypothetical protein
MSGFADDAIQVRTRGPQTLDSSPHWQVQAGVHPGPYGTDGSAQGSSRHAWYPHRRGLPPPLAEVQPAKPRLAHQPKDPGRVLQLHRSSMCRKCCNRCECFNFTAAATDTVTTDAASATDATAVTAGRVLQVHHHSKCCNRCNCSNSWASASGSPPQQVHQVLQVLQQMQLQYQRGDASSSPSRRPLTPPLAATATEAYRRLTVSGDGRAAAAGGARRCASAECHAPTQFTCFIDELNKLA